MSCFVTLGTQRSGNHLCLNFLINGTDGNSILYNNLDPSTLSPSQTEYFGKMPYLNKFYSFENRKTSVLSLPQAHISNISNNDPSIPVLILRSFQNVLSSLSRRLYLLHPPELSFPHDIIKLWIGHCEWALENPYKTIIYDNLVSQTEYQDEIIRRYGLTERSKKAFNKISGYGDGSSFHTKNFLDRWKIDLDNEKYRRVFKKYPEIVEISKQIFNYFPEELL